jgi:NDP-sugar pyrophosphorylase family protein
VDAVVLAAGEGKRMRPLTERWPKALLPIDGRAVLATLLRELASADIAAVTIVTGYLAEQVEGFVGDGRAFGIDARFVRQPRPDGGADAVRRATLMPPFLVTAADTVYAAGTVARFVRMYHEGDGAGAMSVRRQPGRPPATGIRVEGGYVSRAQDTAVPGGYTAAPLLAIGEPVAARLPEVCAPPFRPPYELTDAFQRAIDSGERIRAVEIEPTRDLTDPLDLVVQNFPYLGGP